MPPNASEPESGSVIAQAPTFSKVTRSGSQRSFWASVPRPAMVGTVRPRLTPIPVTSPCTPGKFADQDEAHAAWALSPPNMPPDAPPRTSAPSRILASRFSSDSRAIASMPKVANSFRMIG